MFKAVIMKANEPVNDQDTFQTKTETLIMKYEYETQKKYSIIPF